MTSQTERAELFLAYYGYPPGEAGLSQYQLLAGLPVTGQLDDATVAKMGEKRCGVSDALRSTEDAKWKKNTLTYRVDAYLEGLPKETQDAVYRQAWSQWEAVCGIKLTQVTSGAADIVLSTGRGPRSDFDGPSGTLAWMMLPNGSGQQLLGRFDLDENWVNDPNRDIYLLAVACHEFGHALGLDHDSQSSGSLMAPYYKRQVYKPQANDIRRIQSYYGPPSSTPGPTPTPTPVPGGGFTLNRETVAAIVEFAFAYMQKRVEATASKIDDLIFSLAASQKNVIIDLLMGLFATKGTITIADVEALLSDPATVEKLKAA